MAGSPEVWVSRCRMVTGPWLPAVNAGRYLVTGSSSLSCPCPASARTVLVVATILVSEARSNRLAPVIGRRAPGVVSACPASQVASVVSPRPTAATAPGSDPSVTAATISSPARPRFPRRLSHDRRPGPRGAGPKMIR